MNWPKAAMRARMAAIGSRASRPNRQEERIDCPDSDEYRVSADVVEKAAGLGATIVAYSSSWCEATVEGKDHARARGISVLPFAGLFGYMNRKGVTFTR